MFQSLVTVMFALALVVSPLTPAGAAEYKDTAVLFGKLKEAKLSLIDGIQQAEQSHGVATSAKFEMKDDHLMLSVYTGQEGRDQDAEHNVLMELLGDATKTPWTPDVEVFDDKPHIARSAMPLTLMQASKLSLIDVVKKAASAQPGMVYSANPALRNGEPVVDVLVATADGKDVHLTVNLRTGAVSR